ncbi:hypothetical protein OG939_35910 [Streptomyces sp. NBC_01685]|uniref:hypothetical protein n=1 Tax=Streptomyces sp. NBC_01685 TaxID=2975910 RepID=UPI002E3303F2|nr:hypothetical protein [Streptomyces sp. NBC_01685]
MISNVDATDAVSADLLASGVDALLAGEELDDGPARSLLVSSVRTRFIEIVSEVESRVGAPDLYAGGAAGVLVRWRYGPNALTLAQDRGVTMSLQRSATLDATEAAAFQGGVGDGPGQVLNYCELPYLWQVQRGSAREQPGVPPTSDWSQLEQALQSLLELWVDQTSLLYEAGWCDEVAFDVTEHVSEDRVLGLLQSADDGLTLFLHDDRAAVDQPDPDDMVARGWQQRVQLFRAWVASFAPGPDAAVAAAGIVVRELRLRGADSPLSVSLTALSSTGGNRLRLPGIPLKS